MDRFETCNEAFAHAVSRARDMCQLYSDLSHLRDDPSNDDVLRAVCIQAVSSFDFYVHGVVATEASHRFRNSLPTRNILLPMEITMISDSEERIDAVDLHVRESYSYKTFVDQKKTAPYFVMFL